MTGYEKRTRAQGAAAVVGVDAGKFEHAMVVRPRGGRDTKPLTFRTSREGPGAQPSGAGAPSETMRPSTRCTTRSQRCGDALVVRDDEEGRAAAAVEAAQQLEHLLAALGVEVAGGLVGQHQRRRGDQRAGDGHPLLLRRRRAQWPCSRAGRQAHLLQQRLRALRISASRRPRSGEQRHLTFSRRRRPAAGGGTGRRSPVGVRAARSARRRSAGWSAAPAGTSRRRSGRSSSPIRLSSVLFPEPEGPVSATNSPGPMLRSMPCSTCVTPLRRTPCGHRPAGAAAQPLRMASAGSSRAARRAGSTAATIPTTTAVSAARR
jgi:hypothetical protein